MRLVLHYLFAAVTLMIYGVQVCPYLDSLPPTHHGLSIVGVLGLQLLARRTLAPAITHRATDTYLSVWVFSVDFGLFLAGAVMLATYNAIIHAFPIESGLKIVTGYLAVGFFAALDLSLESERTLAETLKRAGRNLDIHAVLFPISQKLALFAGVSAMLVVGVLFLIVVKDLEWLTSVSTVEDIRSAPYAILFEFAFVGLVILAHVLNVIQSFARNLRMFFQNEVAVLERTNQGDFDGRVPVTTADEFGLIANHTNNMVAAIRARTEELARTQDVTILGFASLAETRDNETGAHLLRTQRYVAALAQRLALDPRHAMVLDAPTIEQLFKSAPLHDIGKVGIPDAILLKPGRLTEDEFAIMKRHPILGAETIAVAESALGAKSSFLRYAREIAENHHEKWDGSGYPRGLRHEEIPLSGRLMAVADVYDALICKRVYKPAFDHQQARDIIVEGRGSHFDPELVDVFLAIEDEIKGIAADFADAG